MAIHVEEFQKLPFPISGDQAMILFAALQVYITENETAIHEFADVHSSVLLNNDWLTAIEAVEAAHDLRDQLIKQFGIVYE